LLKMPDGLKYLLSPDDNAREKVVVILENKETSLFHWEFVFHLVKRFNTEEMTESSAKGSSKTHVLHLILNAVNKDTLDFSSHLTYVYDDLEVQIDDLYQRLMANRRQEEHRDARHIAVIDDLSLLSLLSATRDGSRLSKFLRLICRQFDRTFVFGNSSTLTNQEISRLYEVGTAVAVLGKHQDERSYRTKTSEPLTMVCDLLKLRNEKRASHEQTRFQVCNGEIIELKESSVAAPTSDHHTDILKNLTTFKLTVEDNEKETRSKLYLPYFNAQKKEFDTELDYQEYDDEDEEV